MRLVEEPVVLAVGEEREGVGIGRHAAPEQVRERDVCDPSLSEPRDRRVDRVIVAAEEEPALDAVDERDPAVCQDALERRPVADDAGASSLLPLDLDLDPTELMAELLAVLDLRLGVPLIEVELLKRRVEDRKP